MKRDPGHERPAAPYVGLRPYQEQDRSRFFGRTQDAERLINKIFSARLTLLYAPSAAGKTSLLRTLVVPELRAQDAEVVYFDHWSSERPLQALVAAIEDASGRGESVVVAGKAEPLAALDAGTREPMPSAETGGAGSAASLASACAAAVAARDQTLVLLLDQFEEFLQRHHASPDPLRRELAELVRGSIDVRIVLSFREEFLGSLDACLRDHLPTLFASTFHLAHLGPSGAREAIRAPALPFGLEYSDALVEQILEDLHPRRAGRPAIDPKAAEISLPFLQLICSRLWSKAASRLARGERVLLELRDYVDDLHGRDGVVRTYLAEVTGGLHASQRDDLAELFRWLAPPSGLKLAFPSDTLSEQTGLPPARLQPLLELLQRRNILRARDAGGVTTYEIFHDAFIDIVRPWSREHREARGRRQRRLALVSIAALLVAVVVTNWGWSRYASKAAADLERERQVAARIAAELEREQFAQRIRNIARRGDTKRAIGMSLEKITEREWSVRSVALREALSAHLHMRRLRLAGDTPLLGVAFAPGRQLLGFSEDGALLLWDADTGTQVWPSPEAKTEQTPATASGGADVGPPAVRLHGAIFTTDGTRVLAFGTRLPAEGHPPGAANPSPRPIGYLTMQQLGKRAPEWSVELPTPVSRVALSGDDRWVAAVTDDGRWQLLDAENGRPLSTPAPEGTVAAAEAGDPTTPSRSAPSSPSAILALAFSPDARFLATGDENGRVELLDLPPAEGKGASPRAAVSIGDAIFALAFTPDASRLAIAGFDTPMPPLLVLPSLARAGYAAPAAGSRGEADRRTGSAWVTAISPNGRFVATIAGDGAVELWNANEGGRIAQLMTNSKAPAVTLAFDPQSRRLAVGYGDGRLRLWSTESPERALFDERLQQIAITGLAFSSRGNLLATSGRSIDARVWSLHSFPTLAEIDALLARGEAAHRSPDGLVLAERDGREDKELAVLSAKGEEISRLAIAPEDRLIYGFSTDGRRILVSGQSGNRAYPCALVWCATDAEVVTQARSLFYERSDPDE